MRQIDEYEALLRTLIDGGEQHFTADTFNGAAIGDLIVDSQNFYEGFCQLMNTEGPVSGENSWLQHWFIRKNDIDEAKKSVMGYISKKADRGFKPSEFISHEHWNRSVQDLVDEYARLIGEDEYGGLLWWKEEQGGGE